MGHWVADGLKGMGKFGLEAGGGDWAVHDKRRDSEMLTVGSGVVLNLVTSLCVISSLSPSSYETE